MTDAPPSSTHDPGDVAPGGSALLVIDMISGWDYPDAAPVLARALAIAPRVQRLAERCRAAGVPVIYASDNRGRWRSDQRELVRAALAEGREDTPGARLTRALAPQGDDYFVLKPRHSAFFATPLELLLRDLGAARVVLAGVSADQCVLATAGDARMRQLDVVVPRDCVAAPTPARTRAAVRHFAEVLGVPTPLGSRVRF
jgi:nicotinamidase-related amidase